MPPCAHTTIAASRRGKLEHCHAGECVRLRFGNAVLQLDGEELDTVLEMVAMHDHDGDPAGSDSGEHALIDIGNTGASFAFTRDEVAELHQLLARAVVLLTSTQFAATDRLNPPSSFLHLH